MITHKFILPLAVSNRAIIIEAKLEMATKPKHESFGKVKVVTESHYEPLHILVNDQYIWANEATDVLTKLGFIEVDLEFDKYDIKHLQSIKSKLSEQWIENYNKWANYEG